MRTVSYQSELIEGLSAGAPKPSHYQNKVLQVVSQ
jgi:hypothetical protein